MPVVAAVKKSFTKVFGSRNERLIKAYRKRVERITALEPEIRQLTDAQMRQRVDELRRGIANQGTAQDSLYESFALMRESLDRHVGIRNIFNPAFADQFDVSKLDAQARGLYDKAQAELQDLGPIPEVGQEELVPPWLQVEIPPALYEAVRAIYPKSRPPFRTRPFDVQLIGGMVLYEGKIAEMKTGEGKTIVAPLACATAAIEGLRSHVVTVNDYLVQRDRDWVFPALYKLGITVGAIHPQHMQDEQKKKEAYQCDIVYGTNSEFGFDYLRDNMKLSPEDQVQTRRDFCVIDEVDSILIDEARTPLIISGPAHDDAPQYVKANQAAEQLASLQKQANTDTASRLRQAGFVEEAARLHRVPAAQIEKVIAKFRDLGPDYLDEKEAGYVSHVQYYVIKLEQKQSAMTHLGVEQAQKIVGTRFYVVGNDM
ncbi:MAG: hypothetical protein OER86_10800, partial [Phycisphaerae bacterium]|nr:hypothetical protein [Phycisphaerae bacterium]